MLMSILSTLSGKNPPQWLPEGCTERPRRADKAEMSETAKWGRALSRRAAPPGFLYLSALHQFTRETAKWGHATPRRRRRKAWVSVISQPVYRRPKNNYLATVREFAQEAFFNSRLTRLNPLRGVNAEREETNQNQDITQKWNRPCFSVSLTFFKGPTYPSVCFSPPSAPPPPPPDCRLTEPHAPWATPAQQTRRRVAQPPYRLC